MACLFGRDGVIRTHDPLHPMQVRYQAALRPEPLLQASCNSLYYNVKEVVHEVKEIKTLVSSSF